MLDPSLQLISLSPHPLLPAWPSTRSLTPSVGNLSFSSPPPISPPVVSFGEIRCVGRFPNFFSFFSLPHFLRPGSAEKWSTRYLHRASPPPPPPSFLSQLREMEVSLLYLPHCYFSRFGGGAADRNWFPLLLWNHISPCLPPSLPPSLFFTPASREGQDDPS